MCEFLNNIIHFIYCNWKILLPPAVQFFGILFGAILVAWQVTKQLKEQSVRQIAQARDELYVTIYDTLSQDIQACQEIVGKAGTTVLICPGRISSYWWQKHQGGLQYPTPIPDRGESLSILNYELGLSIGRVISVIERYEIAFPKQRLFYAFKCSLIMQSEKTRDAFGNFWDTAYRFLPIDVPESEQLKAGSAVLEPIEPSDEMLLTLNELASTYLFETHQIQGCLIDLLHEAQNNLLSHLFQRKVPPRIPRKDICLSVRDDEAILSAIEKKAKVWEESLVAKHKLDE